MRYSFHREYNEFERRRKLSELSLITDKSRGRDKRGKFVFFNVFYVKFDYFAKSEKLFLKRLNGAFALLLRLYFFF